MKKRWAILIIIIILLSLAALFLPSFFTSTLSSEDASVLQLLEMKEGLKNISSLEDCRSASNINVKMECLFFYAWYLSDKNICYEFNGMYETYDKNICNELKEKYNKSCDDEESKMIDTCLSRVNEKLNDPEICVEIKLQPDRDYCFEKVAKNLNNNSLCEEINSQFTKKDCLSAVNMSNAYYKICPQFFNAGYSDPSEFCRDFIIKNNTNSSLCPMLPIDRDQEKCLRYTERFNVEGYSESKISAKKQIEEFNTKEEQAACSFHSADCDFAFENNVLTFKVVNYLAGSYSSPIKIFENSSLNITKRGQSFSGPNWSKETPICENPKIISINGGEYFDVPIEVMEEFILRISCNYDFENLENQVILIRDIMLYDYNKGKSSSSTVFLNSKLNNKLD